MSKRILLIMAAFAVVFLAGCTTPDGDGSAEVVRMEGTTFTPGDMVIEAGTTVLFRNVDSQKHNVVAFGEDADWGMASGEMLDGGDSYEYTFTEPGTYEYRCEPHSNVGGDGECSGMCGTITVEAADDGADDEQE